MSDDEKQSDPLFGDDDDARRQAAEDLKARLQTIVAKLSGHSDKEFTLADIAQYLRVINYNFTALVRTLNQITYNQSDLQATLLLMRQELAEMRTEFDNFTKVTSLLDEALDDTDQDDQG